MPYDEDLNKQIIQSLMEARQHHQRDWIAPIVAAVFAAAISAMGASWVTVSSLQVDIARLEERVQGYQTSLLTVTQNRYTSLDALRDTTLAREDRERMQGLLDSIWPRLREMKERIQNLESSRPPEDKRANEAWKH